MSTRRQTSEATESSSMSVTSASSEAPITVSPAAHIIRYTLDSSEVTSELSTRPETEQTENLTPRAEKLVASMAIPSDIFRSVVSVQCSILFIFAVHFPSKIKFPNLFNVILGSVEVRKSILTEYHPNFLQSLQRRFALCSYGQIYNGDFAKFCCLLRIHEL